MHFLLIALSLSLISSSPLLGILEQFNDHNVEQFTLNLFHPDGTSTSLGNLTSAIGGSTILSNTFIPIPQRRAILFTAYYTILIKPIYRIFLADQSTGTILATWPYEDIAITNILYDAATEEAFVTGFDRSSKRDGLYRLDLSSGALVGVVDIGYSLQYGMSAYDAEDHVLFAGVDTPDGSSVVAVVDTRTLKVSSVLLEDDGLVVLHWDSVARVMYAWVGGISMDFSLVRVDIVTGKRLEVVAGFSNVFGGRTVAALDELSGVVYGNLMENRGGAAYPVWVTVNVVTGNSTYTPSDPTLLPVNLVVLPN